MKCSICGNEMRVGPGQCGVDMNNNPIYHTYAFCDLCKVKTDLSGINNVNNLTQKVEVVEKSKGRKESELSTLACICAFFTFTFVIGIILGIIDLASKKQDGKGHKGSVFAIIWGSIIVLFLFGKGMSGGNNKNTGTFATPNNAQSVITSQVEAGNIDTQVSANKSEEKDYKNLKLKDVGEKDGIYIGLAHVKRLSYLPTALGESEIDSENEVIMAYFDMYNSTQKIMDVVPYEITCYADGVQVNGVESYIKVKSDGVNQVYSAHMEPNTQLITCNDYEVKKGWAELKFFYKSTCIWTVSSDEVSNNEYVKEPLLEVENTHDVTKEGTVVYNGNYELTYQGCEIYERDKWGEIDDYAIFKFTLKNTSDIAYDCSFVGYNMRMYLNNYFVDDPNYVLDEKIDGYVNVFSINTIETGMSADIYVAFEVNSKNGNIQMVFDDGYITTNVKCTVYDVK